MAVESKANDQGYSAPARRPFWDNLVEGRECGGCVECCRIFRVDDMTLTHPPDRLEKEPGVLCAHACNGGCNIHPVRPNVCRGWFCLWRRIESIPDDLRPDKLGVIADHEYGSVPDDIFGQRCIVLREIRPGAMLDDNAQALLAMFCQQSAIPVWVSIGGELTLHHPDPALADMVRGDTAISTAYEALVMGWRQALAP